MSKSLREIIEEKKAKALQERDNRERQQEILLAKIANSEPIPSVIEHIVESSECLNVTTPSKKTISFAEKLRLLKEQKHERSDASTPQKTEQNTTANTNTDTTNVDGNPNEEKKKEAFSLSIQLNEKQLLAKELAFAGKTFCLVGAAGTGKTTAQREIAASLLQSNKLGYHDFRVQGTGERISAPSIAFVAYTRVASGNLRRAIHKDPVLEQALEHNVTTIHNLLEYTPEKFFDLEKNRDSMRFIPRRDSSNKLDITHLVIEESSMVSVDLWSKLRDALREGVQIIYIGDINQLTPVFGDAVLGYALTQIPVVELTEVYRQKGDSLVLKNAHNILEGKPVEEGEGFKIVRAGEVNHTQGKLAATLGATFPKWEDKGVYNPMEDIILSPFNVKELGTINMNKWIAQFLGKKREATVFEIIAGMNKVYLAVGDKVMHNKQVGIITAIKKNGRYMGRAYQKESVNLTRFGTYVGTAEEEAEDMDDLDYSNLDLDALIANGEQEERLKESSHFVDILLDDGMEATLSSIGDFADSVFTLAYALTVHKAQGCEWRKVFLIMHRDHSILLSRELFYTAVTRAREAIVVIAKDYVIEKAIKTQKIKGNRLEDKIAYFNSGINLNNKVDVTV